MGSISKTIQIRQIRYVGHCWRNKDEIISGVLLCTSSHRHASVGRPTRTYLQQLSMDTGCSLEVMSEAMDVRDKWQEKIREIHVSSPTLMIISWVSLIIFLRYNSCAKGENAVDHSTVNKWKFTKLFA